jgi:hypothetical protein
MLLRERDWLWIGGSFVGGTLLLHVSALTAEAVVVYVVGAGVQWVWSWYSYGWRAKEVG